MKNKIYLRKLLLISYLKYLIVKKKHLKIRFISNKQEKNNIKEDVLLIVSLRNKGVNAKIISYENTPIEKNAIYVLKNNQENNLEGLMEYLNEIQNNGNKLINPYNIIMDSFDNEKQYKLLLKYNIPHLNSYFINNDNLFKENILTITKDNSQKWIIKSPTNCENYLYNETLDLNNIIKNNNKIILQEYCDGIKDGEISLIYIKHNLSHIIKRYSKEINEKNSIEQIFNIDEYILNIGNLINNIEEYREAFYLKINLIKQDNKYLVLEVETLSPKLYLIEGCNEETAEDNIDRYTDGLIDYIRSSI